MYFDDTRHKWYADWRDKKGKRHRQSFTSEKAALAFEGQMKAASPKNSSTRANAATSSSHTSEATGSSVNSDRSSRSRVMCIRESSQRRMPSQSIKPSKRGGGQK